MADASSFDLVVIGAGPAGEKAAAQAAFFRKKVLVIESAPDPGGAAVHTGTLPSKTLRETALYMSGYRQRALYGISCRINRDVSVPDLMCRQEPVIGAEAGKIRENLRKHDIDLLDGTATFLDEHTLEIVPTEGVPKRVTADAI